MSQEPLRLAFFGTPEFALPILDALEQAGRLPVAVICQPDRPRGRGRKRVPPPVNQWAMERRVPVIQPERCKQPEFLEAFRALRPDIALVAAFGQLLPRVLLDIPPQGFINVHPSAVPRYRGAAPMQWTLINGDRETAVSILRVTPRLDDGDILLQEITSVDPDETLIQLQGRLGALGGDLAVRALAGLEAGDLKGMPQTEGPVVWAPALTKEDGHIDWSQPATVLHNRIRGVQPWPGAFTHLHGKLLKIMHAAVDNRKAPAGAQPGQVLSAEGEHLVIQTGQGALRLLQVQLEGKKQMDARTFLLGRPLRAGDTFEASVVAS